VPFDKTRLACGLPSLRLLLDPQDDADEAEEEDGDDGESEAEEPAPAGVMSRFGGWPDLPPSVEWPEAGGRPMLFVAQFVLADLARYQEASELPREGVLSFFYDPFPESPCLVHPVVVFHLPSVEGLARRTPPASTEGRVPACAIESDAETMFPGVESPFYLPLVPEEHQAAFFRSLRDASQGDHEPVADPLSGLGNAIWQLNASTDQERPTHRLLGHASSIQGDPYLDIEVACSLGGWDGWEEGSPQALRARARARRWRLLLQIDAQQDGELLLNQDGGFFYFWIPEEALARRDWSQVRGALQCH
jgi:hypothetical protein